MEARQLLQLCFMMVMQLSLLLMIINIRTVINSPKCPRRSPNADEMNLPTSIWYYEHVYDHQPAHLRVLTDREGAAPLRSKTPPRTREITIVAGAWKSTSCRAANYISTDQEQEVHVLEEADISPLYEKLKQLHARVEAVGRCRMDIQMVKEDAADPNDARNKYPVNGMRNMAWRMARTDLIFLLDADFRPSFGMHESLTEDEGNYQELVKKATKERHLFVVPAFEILRSVVSAGQGNFTSPQRQNISVPVTKQDVKRGWEAGLIDCFHCAFSPASHEPTQFNKYFDPAITSPYSVSYMEGYEPYMIVARTSTPMYDERFRGYGKNKISQIYACVHGHGMSFQVLPNAFIFEVPHPPSVSRKYWENDEDTVRNLYRVLGLYRRFKKEVMQQRLVQLATGVEPVISSEDGREARANSTNYTAVHD